MATEYCGNAAIKETSIGKVVNIELDITQLRAILNELKMGQSQAQIRVWTDKAGVEHEVIKLSALPLRAPKNYLTHAIKIDTYVPKKRDEDTPKTTHTPQSGPEHDDDYPPLHDDDDLPF